MLEWVLIFGMMLVTFVPRFLPLALVDHFKLPPLLMRALPYIPLAVLSAIVAQNSFFIEGQLALSPGNDRLITAAVAVLVAYFTKSLSLTVLIGFGVFILFHYIL